MMAASVSMQPSLLRAGPTPALNSGLSSSTSTAASTAFTALPPPDIAFQPACAASSTARKRSGIELGSTLPHPPWTMIAGLFIAIPLLPTPLETRYPAAWFRSEQHTHRQGTHQRDRRRRL